MADGLTKIRAILEANKDKSFVQRILNYQGPGKSPVLEHEGGYATHRMAWGEADGQYVVYPTVLLGPDGKLADYGDRAWDQVAKSGNYITFKSPRDAEWFSQNYKAVWPENLR